MRNDRIKILNVAFFCCLVYACSSDNDRRSLSGTSAIDLQQIKARGTLIAATDYNSINYYILNGRPLGFQYELLERFAASIGVRLTIQSYPDLIETFKKLNNRSCDIIAMNLTELPERNQIMSFSDPLLYTRQVLVQKKVAGYDTLPEEQITKHLIRDLKKLDGKTVYVHSKSSFLKAISDIQKEQKLKINIIEVDEKTERLVELVSRGDIEYTICDELTGLVYISTFPNIDISTPVTDLQYLSWAVNKDAPKLLDTLNRWMGSFKKTLDYAVIFNRYYKNKYYNNITSSNLYAIKSGRISNYDSLIRKYSHDIGWDWRLLASLIYLESKFEHTAESHRGAFGIMQLMPETARQYGVSERSSPEAQIRAGIRVMNDILTYFKTVIPDSAEQIKFTLASYNIGIGHILDAQAIAKKTGKNPFIWDNNVDSSLMLKANPVYAKDPEVKFGRINGSETLKYVNNILDLYSHYKNIIEE